MKISPDTPKRIAKLYQRYQKLNPYEQCILKALAVLYSTIGVSRFNQLLSHLNRIKCFPDGTHLPALKPDHRSQLVEQGFIHYDSSGMQLTPFLLNPITYDCIAEGSYDDIARNIEPFAAPYNSRGGYARHRDIAGQIRDAYFLGATQDLEKLFEFNKNPQIINIQHNRILIELCFLPFELEKFLSLSDTLQYQAFATWFWHNTLHSENNQYLLNLLEQSIHANPDNPLLCCLCAEIHLYAMRFELVDKALSGKKPHFYALQLQATALMLQGQFAQASEVFNQAFAAKNKLARRKRQYLSGVLGTLHKLFLLILAGEDARYYEQALEQIHAEIRDKHTENHQRILLYTLDDTAECLSSGRPHPVRKIREQVPNYFFHLQTLINYLGLIWCEGKLDKDNIADLKQSIAYFTKTDALLFATLGKQLLSTQSKKQKPEKNNTLVYFPDLVQCKAEWDIALEKLLALSPTAEPQPEAPAENAKPTRLIWEMHGNYRYPSFKAREQKQTAKGWSKGRTVALKRLANETESFDYLSEGDKQMCAAIEHYQSWDYHQSSIYELDGIAALNAASKLQNVYLPEDLENPIEIVRKEPELLVSQQEDQLVLSIADVPSSHYIETNINYSVRQVSKQRYHYTVFKEPHLKVAQIIGEGGLSIPVAAKQKALDSIRAIAPLLNIQSDINELDTGLETLTCDEHLVINIQPLEEGLQFTCVVMPFGDEGPALKPMAGNAKLTAELANKRVATQRDLSREQQQMDALDQHCPAFLNMPDNVLHLEDPQSALATLEQLEQLINSEPPPIPLRLRWPKGKKITLSKPLTREQLQLAIGKEAEWFDISGNLQIDEEQVLELRALLELVANSSGRFISLDSGQVLALSQDLRERLEQLNHATDAGKFHALASLQVAEATTGMRMRTLHAWEQQTQLMHEANAIQPAVPSTLQAELRDYQLEGFDWLSRLAHWKAGACLADDMGLGKTLQALALLLSRAAGGPSLVIAPTSVCYNWQQEALKFAPTLTVHIFSEQSTSEQRQQLLSQAGKFDCVVISYGLLHKESERLAAVHWHTIVADEAQALKNPLAKRTQAAYALKGDFKIITTGTPIENNLSELWSLFRFITPGLLGNIKRFGERYAFPIENVKQDKLAARKASLGLKTLIQPFILRRMKNQVLTELPPRTEINKLVELSPKEQNFYEALRRNAVDNILKAGETAGEGEQRIRMLAELVKLRQACCHPKLVLPESTLGSAKLEALDELLDELQQNHHKALIFSQFVGHLKMIRAHLDKRQMSYQYLDGSTPQKARKASVEAFQNGEGEVFLISLKAGGSGLNLTAADYVIHMDPWWNPAVEEQASDRAHRMGQKRPVTIYRLIAKNTIEERIVALHQHKRDLADKLLSGNEQASKLSVEEILSMLKETF